LRPRGASIQANQLVVTAVNPHASNERVARIAVRARKVVGGRATVLTSNDIHAHNSFAAPKTLEPVTQPLDRYDVYRFQPASVTRLDLTLA
jgi:alpha-N-arabinofuranosidase